MVRLLKKTPLNKVHHELRARMTYFAGWELPVWYASVLEEHRAVRSGAGIFDVSDMGRIWITGRNAGAFLDKVLTKRVGRLEIGSSQLCLLCLEDGGILDDLLAYRVETDCFLIVCNAGNIEPKLGWLDRWAGSDPDVVIRDKTADTVMVAVQGPTVRHLQSLKDISNLPRFGVAQTRIEDVEVIAARTGYTGEDGFEIISDATNALHLWQSFMKQGVKPCGLGARDSLRLEAGMLLYGQDMDRNTNPFEAGLEWLVEMNDRDFVGKSALLEIKRQGVKRKHIGLRVTGQGIARPGYKIVKGGREVGKVTSGGYSPTLDISIGFGYVPIELATVNTDIEIMIRSKPVAAQVVNRQFYKRGA
ncbi:MAG: glycine cleavage system aminomethyltransferase GcvT [Dehalococcoidia bacterium]|nr:glycine cleavage system aminomethyltransferase GcvT [Dehalococcoidia bacterium]MDH4299396.1 glycine cleavage system aminomethyltransferase GcvT [Dehalococcoidia bacterium]MDH4366985.1 glycine cleavage system aminomethyltransferase GcvT [Dehalococcoidia bacterium]